MNMPLPAHNKALFDLEVLRARLEIRDFFLDNLYREVYENIGQLLSLARVMLALRGDHVEAASDLVGRSIQELRTLCRSFYVDQDLLKDDGFSLAITNIIAILFPGPGYPVKQISIANEADAGLKLIVFAILLEALQKIREINGKPELVAVSISPNNIDCNLHYRGGPLPLDGHSKFEVLQNEDGAIHLKLFCPLN